MQPINSQSEYIRDEATIIWYYMIRLDHGGSWVQIPSIWDSNFFFSRVPLHKILVVLRLGCFGQGPNCLSLHLEETKQWQVFLSFFLLLWIFIAHGCMQNFSQSEHSSAMLDIFAYWLTDSLMSRIDRKYCFTSTSYLAGLFDIYILLHIWRNSLCFGDFLIMKTLCNANHKEFESHKRSIQ